MPWKDPEKRRAAQKAYRATRRAQELARQAKDRYYMKRRGECPPDMPDLKISAQALAAVLSSWWKGTDSVMDYDGDDGLGEPGAREI